MLSPKARRWRVSWYWPLFPNGEGLLEPPESRIGLLPSRHLRLRSLEAQKLHPDGGSLVAYWIPPSGNHEGAETCLHSGTGKNIRGIPAILLRIYLRKQPLNWQSHQVPQTYFFLCTFLYYLKYLTNNFTYISKLFIIYFRFIYIFL